MSITILDKHGDDIIATFSNDTAAKYHPQDDAVTQPLEKGSMYTFSGGRVKVANAEWNNCKSKYEISFNNNCEITKVQDDGAVQKVAYSRFDIAQIEHTEPGGRTVDILASVLSFKAHNIFTSKKGNEITKRELVLGDESGASIRCTLWGDQAFTPDEKFENNPIVLITRCKIVDYGGRSLWGAFSGGVLEFNPSFCTELPKVQQWLQSGGAHILAESNKCPGCAQASSKCPGCAQTSSKWCCATDGKHYCKRCCPGCSYGKHKNVVAVNNVSVEILDMRRIINNAHPPPNPSNYPPPHLINGSSSSNSSSSSSDHNNNDAVEIVKELSLDERLQLKAKQQGVIEILDDVQPIEVVPVPASSSSSSSSFGSSNVVDLTEDTPASSSSSSSPSSSSYTRINIHFTLFRRLRELDPTMNVAKKYFVSSDNGTSYKWDVERMQENIALLALAQADRHLRKNTVCKI